MISTSEALQDENIPPPGNPISPVIGRQASRVKTSVILRDHQETSEVDDTVVGRRVYHLVSLSLQRLVADPNMNQASLVAVVQAAVNQAFVAACEPNGAVSNAITAACQPNGAISNAITAACQPNGAISNAITAACQPNGAISNVIMISEGRQLARIQNGRISSPTDTIFALPNSQGIYPAMFPQTLQQFWAMNNQIANQLLDNYGLDMGGLLANKRKRLALFCNILPL
jgi:hypothetical protein